MAIRPARIFHPSADKPCRQCDRRGIDGSVGSITLHVMNGTADEIKVQLLDSVDAFFNISAGTPMSDPHHS